MSGLVLQPSARAMMLLVRPDYVVVLRSYFFSRFALHRFLNYNIAFLYTHYWTYLYIHGSRDHSCRYLYTYSSYNLRHHGKHPPDNIHTFKTCAPRQIPSSDDRDAIYFAFTAPCRAFWLSLNVLTAFSMFTAFKNAVSPNHKTECRHVWAFLLAHSSIICSQTARNRPSPSAARRSQSHWCMGAHPRHTARRERRNLCGSCI